MENISLLNDDNNRLLLNKIKILKRLNVFFLVLTVLALIYEMTIFSFYNWVIDVFIIIQIIFALTNVGFLLSHEDTQAFWLNKRQYFIYTPFAIMMIVTIVQLGIVGNLLFNVLENNPNKD